MELDVEKSRNELVKTARKMISDYSEVGAIVLECTNMPPYAAAIQQEIGLPVFDIYTLANMVYQAVVRREFSGYM
jgi:Asp/Glu/hydantoin racemase